MIAQDERAGALPTLYAALADVPGDSYAGPDGRMEMRGEPKLVGRSEAAEDTDVARPRNVGRGSAFDVGVGSGPLLCVVGADHPRATGLIELNGINLQAVVLAAIEQRVPSRGRHQRLL